VFLEKCQEIKRKYMSSRALLSVSRALLRKERQRERKRERERERERETERDRDRERECVCIYVCREWEGARE